MPTRVHPRFWVQWEPETPYHECDFKTCKSLHDHQPLISFQNQRLAPRGQVYFQGSGDKMEPPSKASNLSCQEVSGPLERFCWPMSSADNVEWTESSLWEEGEDKNGRGF